MKSSGHFLPPFPLLFPHHTAMAISAVDLQAEINALRSMEANLNKVHAARQKYMSQHNENKLVLAELKMLKEGATVFKMSTFPPTCGIPPPPDPAAPAAARAAICAARARGDSACFLCVGGGEGRAGEGAEESRPSRSSPSLLLSFSVLLLSLALLLCHRFPSTVLSFR